MIEHAGATTDLTGSRGVTQLVQALLHEVGTLDELYRAALQQRAGVAQNDQDAIEASIRVMGRTLFTLEEAKKQRQRLLDRVSGCEGTTLDGLESVLNGHVPDELGAARTAMQRAAIATARELAINNNILDRAVQAGDIFLQRLFSGLSDPEAGYHEGPEDRGDRGALLFNATV